MRLHRGLLGWGIFLIVAGAIPLAVQGGYLTRDQLRDVGSLWPLILVGIGVGLVLSRTRLAFLGGAIAGATLGVMAGGLLAGGGAWFTPGACEPGTGTTTFPPQYGSFGGQTASVDLTIDCGTATVTVGVGNAWWVQGQDATGAGPVVEASTTALNVRSRDAGGPLDLFGKRESWQIRLPDATQLDTHLTLNAGSVTLNLAGARLAGLEATVNAGGATIDLGSVSQLGGIQIGLNAGSLDLSLPKLSVAGSIEANAGSVRLCAPAGAALRLQTDESFAASNDFEAQGLRKNGSAWESPGYDGAAVQIDLQTRANAGSFSLNPEGGCHG